VGAIPGISLSDEIRRAIDAHVRLLLGWSSAINLTAIHEADAIAREHVIDSLTALPILRSAGVDEFVDLGSGAGFPGLPLAMALPARRALLVESIGKKARFLETVLGAVELPVVGVAAVRAETLAADPRHRGAWQAVVARAVASLPELAELALPLLRPGGILVAWKRRPLDEELARAERALRELRGRVASVRPVAVPGLQDHVLVVVEKTGETPGGLPRDPAARRRRPLGGLT
jgi:16S rRNA (guanine527-N7)-methyltransferase